MDRSGIIERYKKRKYFILKEYKGHLKKNSGYLDYETRLKWVNLIQVALIFYDICSKGSLGFRRKRYVARRQVERFEEENRFSSEIFKTAERMFL
jgi:hypothetical protein